MIASAIGVVTALPLIAIELAAGFRPSFNATVVTGMVYMTLIGSIVTTIMYNYVIDRLGPAKAGFGVHLVPVWGMRLAFALLGEVPTWLAVGGFVVIIIGIVVGQTSRR